MDDKRMNYTFVEPRHGTDEMDTQERGWTLVSVRISHTPPSRPTCPVGVLGLVHTWIETWMVGTHSEPWARLPGVVPILVSKQLS